ncbi:MAG: glycosyltransferase family 2 protein [Candidatus Promineofilum sp.]|nr:glycosyltransferase family 2 protein [Promineifilum sp.]
MTRPTLSVIILNWNGRPYLEACLVSLEAQTLAPERIVLVDNGSSDGSVAFVRERFPQVTVCENGGNLGFAAGNNVALREATTDIVVLLNPDVILSPDTLSALAESMADDATIGIVGCKLWYPGGDLIQHAGGYITHPQALPRHYGIGERDTGQYDVTREVEYLIGAAAALRVSMLDRIGLMDEGFFLYFEDVDLCARARHAGYRVVYLPQATAVHVESATAVKGSFAYLQRFHAGRWRYLLKHFPIEEIGHSTLTVEAEWLDRLAAPERRAASLAYLMIIRRLSSIWAAREEEGAGPVSPEIKAAVASGLASLRARATRFAAEQPARLSAVAELRERPFTSDVPVFGPLIARFRAAWNNVASRWYLGHFMNQQSEFNRLAVREIERYETELHEQMVLLEEQIVQTVELQQQIESLEAGLAQLRQGATDPSIAHEHSQTT